MKMPNTPNINEQYFSDKKENPDLLKQFDRGDYYTQGVDDIIPVGFDPIFIYLGQVNSHTPFEDFFGVIHALVSNVKQNLEQFFMDLDRHLGDPSIIRRRYGNWEHPENEAIGVELIQRTPNEGKGLADLIPLVEAARNRGHDIDKVLRDLLDKDPVEKREVLS